MTSKEERLTDQWLSRALYARADKIPIQEKIAELRSQYTSITTQLSGMPHGSSKNHKFDSYVIAIDELLDQMDKLTGIENEVRHTIDKVEDRTLHTILLARYVSGDKWETISTMLGYDYQGGYIWVLRRRALAAVKQYIEIQ